jgi:NADPH2:quinone reductase
MDMPKTMRVLELTGTTGPDAVQRRERPTPTVGEDEALVEVRACGVNFADYAQSIGRYVGAPLPPYVLGMEMAGRVRALGSGAEARGLSLGARVMGLGPAAFADYVAWPATLLMPVPDAWSDAQAAAFPAAWLTAHGCLRVCGRLRAGETVVVPAAAGGVGSAAVRLAKHYGARVIATCSTYAKLQIAHALGADALVNSETHDLAAEVRRLTDGRGADLVLEMGGGESFEHSIEAAAPYGRVVVYGAANQEQKAVTNVALIVRPVEVMGYHLGVMASRRPDLFAAQLAEVGGLIASGIIRPDAPHEHRFDDVADALAALGNRETTGKLVLVA